jgi:hypothetical protein
LREKEAHIRRSQYRLWMREKECKIVSGEEKPIDVSRFKYWERLPETFDEVVLSVDPASSDSPKADKHVTTLLGFRGLDCFVIAISAAEKNDPGKATNDFFNMLLLVRPRKGVVEANAYQRVFKWILEQEMNKKKLWLPMELLEVRTSNADRIMQTIPSQCAYGHFWLHASMTEVVTQADDYDPAVKDIADDYLTAIANGIISSNPALRLTLIEQRGTEPGSLGLPAELAHLYKRREIRACP